MPIYHFYLKTSWNPSLIDRDGEEFPDDAAAYEHALEVAQEIMRNRETKCRSYRLEVRNEDLEPCFEVLFASVDGTLDHLPDDLRNPLIELARTTSSLNETIGQARSTARGIRETLIRADRVLTSIGDVRPL